VEWRESYSWKWGIVVEREKGRGGGKERYARDFDLGLVIFWSPVCATAGGTVLHSARVSTHSRSRLFGQ